MTTLTATFALFENSHGLRCAGCAREIGRGQPYADRPHGLAQDGTEHVDLVCAYCAYPDLDVTP